MLSEEKKTEFIDLFQEFLDSYPYTQEGLTRTAAYEKLRQQGRRNFEAIAAAADSGEDVTEAVLLQLLPYEQNTDNQQKGAWIHIAPAITKDIKNSFQRANRMSSQNWSRIARGILDFVSLCNEHPEYLTTACNKLYRTRYCRDMQIGMLTPILSALRPDEFLLITKKTKLLFNYFGITHYSDRLTDYPNLNLAGRKLIDELSDVIHKPGAPAIEDGDIFDMFYHWIFDVKEYVLRLKLQLKTASTFTHGTQQAKIQPEYTLSQCAETTFCTEIELKFWVSAIHRKGQAIIYGAPGTGKTFIAQNLAKHLISGGNGFSELIQFHPAYSYEDFIQGIRPQSEDGKLTYPLVPGRFLKFCQQAESCQDICVLIIDEINRANLSQVFGELMYLLEYRDREIPLAGGNSFRIPKNVRIIGTMNTADRSIALVDNALRRRFAFIPLHTNYDILRRYYQKTGLVVDSLIQVLQQVNQAIADKNYEIGISFFITKDLPEDIENIWRMEIEPYLEEYFFSQPDKIEEFCWEKVQYQIQLFSSI